MTEIIGMIGLLLVMLTGGVLLWYVLMYYADPPYEVIIPKSTKFSKLLIIALELNIIFDLVLVIIFIKP